MSDQIRKQDNKHYHESMWDVNKITGRVTTNDRAEGWGFIMGAASTMIAWAIVVQLDYDPNFGILFGSMGMGAWKVFRNGRW